LRQMLLEPEFLAAVEADVHLIADLISLRSVMPEKTKDTARQVVRKVVLELLARLDGQTTQAVRGALNRSQRTPPPPPRRHRLASPPFAPTCATGKPSTAPSSPRN